MVSLQFRNIILQTMNSPTDFNCEPVPAPPSPVYILNTMQEQSPTRYISQQEATGSFLYTSLAEIFQTALPGTSLNLLLLPSPKPAGLKSEVGACRRGKRIRSHVEVFDVFCLINSPSHPGLIKSDSAASFELFAKVINPGWPHLFWKVLWTSVITKTCVLRC